MFRKVDSDVSSDWSDGMNDVSENIKSRRAKYDPVKNKQNLVKDTSPRRFVMKKQVV